MHLYTNRVGTFIHIIYISFDDHYDSFSFASNNNQMKNNQIS